MYKIYTGIVLKRVSYKEADEILSLWSWEEGKARILARGVKRSTGRLKSILQPLSWLEIKTASSGFLPIAVSVKKAAAYPGLAGRLDLIAGVFNLFEMVLRSTPDNQPNRQISVLLRQSLEFLEKKREFSLDFLNQFTARLLSALGHGGNWRSCSHCSRGFKPEEKSFFSPFFSAAICSGCRSSDPSAWPVDPGLRDYLDKLESSGSRADLVCGEPSAKISAEAVLSEIFDSIIERRLNSKRFLKQQLALT